MAITGKTPEAEAPLGVTSPQGVAAVGASPDQAKMAGTPAQVRADLLKRAVQPQSISDLTRARQQLASERTAAFGAATPKEEYVNQVSSFNAIAKLPDAVSKKYIDALYKVDTGITLSFNIDNYEGENKEALQAYIQSLGGNIEFLDRMLSNPGDVEPEEAKRFEEATGLTIEDFKEQNKASITAVEEEVRDVITTAFNERATEIRMADVVSTPGLLQGLGIDEGDITATLGNDWKSLSWEQFQDRVEDSKRSFSNVTELKQLLNDPTSPPVLKQEAARQLRAMGATGELAAYSAYERAAEQLSEEVTVNIGGREFTAEELKQEGPVVDHIMEIMQGGGDPYELFENQNPAVADLIQEAVHQIEDMRGISGSSAMTERFLKPTNFSDIEFRELNFEQVNSVASTLGIEQVDGIDAAEEQQISQAIFASMRENTGGASANFIDRAMVGKELWQLSPSEREVAEQQIKAQWEELQAGREVLSSIPVGAQRVLGISLSDDRPQPIDPNSDRGWVLEKLRTLSGDAREQFLDYVEALGQNEGGFSGKGRAIGTYLSEEEFQRYLGSPDKEGYLTTLRNLKDTPAMDLVDSSGKVKVDTLRSYVADEFAGIDFAEAITFDEVLGSLFAGNSNLSLDIKIPSPFGDEAGTTAQISLDVLADLDVSKLPSAFLSDGKLSFVDLKQALEKAYATGDEVAINEAARNLREAVRVVADAVNAKVEREREIAEGPMREVRKRYEGFTAAFPKEDAETFNTHFNAQAQTEVGKRYFKAVLGEEAWNLLQEEGVENGILNVENLKRNAAQKGLDPALVNRVLEVLKANNTEVTPEKIKERVVNPVVQPVVQLASQYSQALTKLFEFEKRHYKGSKNEDWYKRDMANLQKIAGDAREQLLEQLTIYRKEVKGLEEYGSHIEVALKEVGNSNPRWLHSDWLDKMIAGNTGVDPKKPK